MASATQEVIEMLKVAYNMELETVLNYLANSTNPDGVRAEEIKKSLSRRYYRGAGSCSAARQPDQAVGRVCRWIGRAQIRGPGAAAEKHRGHHFGHQGGDQG